MGWLTDTSKRWITECEGSTGIEYRQDEQAATQVPTNLRLQRDVTKRAPLISRSARYPHTDSSHRP